MGGSIQEGCTNGEYKTLIGISQRWIRESGMIYVYFMITIVVDCKRRKMKTYIVLKIQNSSYIRYASSDSRWKYQIRPLPLYYYALSQWTFTAVYLPPSLKLGELRLTYPLLPSTLIYYILIPSTTLYFHLLPFTTLYSHLLPYITICSLCAPSLVALADGETKYTKPLRTTDRYNYILQYRSHHVRLVRVYVRSRADVVVERLRTKSF